MKMKLIRKIIDAFRRKNKYRYDYELLIPKDKHGYVVGQFTRCCKKILEDRSAIICESDVAEIFYHMAASGIDCCFYEAFCIVIFNASKEHKMHTSRIIPCFSIYATSSNKTLIHFIRIVDMYCILAKEGYKLEEILIRIA